MVQRRRLFAEVDDEVRRYINGQSRFNKHIEQALESSDELTRRLVLFRAKGGDYRQAMRRFNISESTFYRRIADFRRALIFKITGVQT